MAIDGFDRPQHPEYLDYNRRFNEEIGKLPAATAYSAAHKQLNDFIVANPHTTYMGYKADPAVKAQYDALHKALKNSQEALGAEQLRWQQENPYTGPEPLIYTMGINTDSTVTGGAAGGTTTTNTGAAATGIDPSQSTLSASFGPYVQDMLSKGWGLANLGFQPYTGERFAPASPLQQQAFMGYQNLQMPQQFGIASNMMADAGMRAAGMGYMPSTFGNFFQGIGAYQPSAFAPGFGYQAGPATQFGNQFQAPGQYQTGTFSGGYQAPQAYQPGQFSTGFQAPSFGPATQFGNQFQAPGQYRPSTDFTAGIGQGQYQGAQFTPGFNYQPGQITTGLGPVGSVQDYMSPYISGVTDIEAREAQRQADIARQGRGARFAQAGAFGGARQAIEEAEAQRNLATQIGDIRTRGLQGAFDRALAQRAQEAQLGMTAQQQTEAARQFGAERGAQFGLEAQRAAEASRQFGAQFGQQGLGQLLEARRAQEQSQQFAAQQGMTAAQLQAQYGLSSQQAQEAARQFDSGQQMTAAQLQAQFGMEAQKAQELSRQFASGQAARSAEFGAQQALEAQRAAEASRQFGAQQGMTAAQLQAQYGLSAQQAQEAARQFNAGQTLSAAQLQAQFGMDAQKAQEMSRQFAAQQALQQAQEFARYGLAGAQQTEASRQFGAQYGLDALRQQLAAAQGLGSLGTQQFEAQQRGLADILRAGETQRAIAQQPLDFGYQQFQESLKYPYQQATFMQSLLQGLPLQAPRYETGASTLGALTQGGLGGALLYNLLFGKGT